MKLWQLIAIMLACLTSSLAIMEKGGIFLVVLCTMYMLYERKVVRLRTMTVVALLLVVGMYIFNLMREGVDSDYSQNEGIMDFIGMYVMSPPVAFCTVHRDISSQFGVNTFEVVYNYLQRFGYGPFDLHEKLQEFVFVPVSTNVYTIMQPFYRDFGYIGVGFFAWIYGLATGIVYRFSCNGNRYCICLYTYLVELLVLQFYQENFFLSLSFNLQFLFLLLLYLAPIKISPTTKHTENSNN